jgi:hypothetical protein
MRNYLVYGWLTDITLKSLSLFTFPTGIQLASDSIISDLFDVTARVKSPAVQGLVITRDVALAFGCAVYCEHVLVSAQRSASLKVCKGKLSRFHFEINQRTQFIGKFGI